MECPLPVLTDSYKSTHFLMYPEAKEMRAYGEFRKPFDGMRDERIVVYGTKYYISNIIEQTFCQAEIDYARQFLTTHLLSPKISVEKYFMGLKNGNYLNLLLEWGKFPVKIEAMPEGSVIRPHVPLYMITAKGEHSRLCTFLETVLTMLWYPCCVATLSRHTKTLIEEAYEQTVDPPDENKKDDPWDITTKMGHSNSLNSRLHDFGFRGCTSVEQSVIGGCAHLVNFAGSDTMSACYYAQNILNKGKPVGFSIPATEHSVMTSWDTEIEAVKNLCKQFPNGPVSCVMDAYDYDRMLDEGLKTLRPEIERNNCTFIVRPDSGDPVKQVLKALEKGEEAGFECPMNGKGYKVFKNYAVLQGDGINYSVVEEILKAVKKNNYAACNVAFGMGGGLLQKVNRDTMSFATKLCYMKNLGDDEIAVVKYPKGEEGKMSLGGKMDVLHEVDSEENMIGPHFVCTEEAAKKYLKIGKNGKKFKRSMQLIYDGTEKTTPSDTLVEIAKFKNETFQDVKDRTTREWAVPYDTMNVKDGSLLDAQNASIAQIKEKLKRSYPQAATVLGASMDSSAEDLIRILDRLV